MTPPVRVLIVATAMTGGGAERVMSTILRHVDRDRVQPSLALLRPAITYPVPPDVQVHNLHYGGLRTFMQTARRLRDTIRFERPDAVLSSVNATNLLTGWALRDRALQLPWIARIGSNPGLHDNRIRRWVGKRVYGRADRLVPNSRGLAGEMERCYPETRGRIAVIPNPTDFGEIDRRARMRAALARERDRPLVIAVGRLFREKRYDVMLKAFARVVERIDAELWVCGDGPGRPRLERLAATLSLSQNVRWLGFVANPYAVMRQADLFLMTSDHEGLPNALIEAQGLGLPAVATRCPHGPSEIIEDDLTGTLVPVGDAEEIGRATAALLLNEERRREMGSAARRRARRLFASGPLISAWENLIEQTVGQPSP